MRAHPISTVALSLALLAGWGCAGDDLVLPGGPGSGLTLVSGTGQEGSPGVPLPEALVVRLVDEEGIGVPNRTVLWVAASGSGVVDPSSGMTDSEGYASAEWTLGPAEGTQRATARVPDIGSATFTATNLEDDDEEEPPPEPEPEVDRLVFLRPPEDVDVNEGLRVEVALVDADGDVVPLSGIFIYVALFREGADTPANDLLGGERFENTDDGVAAFDLAVEEPGRYRLRALTDDLPELGPHGPEPYLFSEVFEVER